MAMSKEYAVEQLVETTGISESQAQRLVGDRDVGEYGLSKLKSIAEDFKTADDLFVHLKSGRNPNAWKTAAIRYNDEFTEVTQGWEKMLLESEDPRGAYVAILSGYNQKQLAAKLEEDPNFFKSLSKHWTVKANTNNPEVNAYLDQSGILSNNIAMLEASEVFKPAGPAMYEKLKRGIFTNIAKNLESKFELGDDFKFGYVASLDTNESIYKSKVQALGYNQDSLDANASPLEMARELGALSIAEAKRDTAINRANYMQNSRWREMNTVHAFADKLYFSTVGSAGAVSASIFKNVSAFPGEAVNATLDVSRAINKTLHLPPAFWEDSGDIKVPLFDDMAEKHGENLEFMQESVNRSVQEAVVLGDKKAYMALNTANRASAFATYIASFAAIGGAAPGAASGSAAIGTKAWATAELSNGAYMGLMQALTTPGSISERVKRGSFAAIMASTPIISGRAGSAYKAFTADAGLNLVGDIAFDLTAGNSEMVDDLKNQYETMLQLDATIPEAALYSTLMTFGESVAMSVGMLDAKYDGDVIKLKKAIAEGLHNKGEAISNTQIASELDKAVKSGALTKEQLEAANITQHLIDYSQQNIYPDAIRLTEDYVRKNSGKELMSIEELEPRMDKNPEDFDAQGIAQALMIEGIDKYGEEATMDMAIDGYLNGEISLPFDRAELDRFIAETGDIDAAQASAEMTRLAQGLETSSKVSMSRFLATSGTLEAAIGRIKAVDLKKLTTSEVRSHIFAAMEDNKPFSEDALRLAWPDPLADDMPILTGWRKIEVDGKQYYARMPEAPNLLKTATDEQKGNIARIREYIRSGFNVDKLPKSIGSKLDEVYAVYARIHGMDNYKPEDVAKALGKPPRVTQQWADEMADLLAANFEETFGDDAFKTNPMAVVEYLKETLPDGHDGDGMIKGSFLMKYRNKAVSELEGLTDELRSITSQLISGEGMEELLEAASSLSEKPDHKTLIDKTPDEDKLTEISLAGKLSNSPWVKKLADRAQEIIADRLMLRAAADVMLSEQRLLGSESGRTLASLRLSRNKGDQVDGDSNAYHPYGAFSNKDFGERLFVGGERIARRLLSYVQLNLLLNPQMRLVDVVAPIMSRTIINGEHLASELIKVNAAEYPAGSVRKMGMAYARHSLQASARAAGTLGRGLKKAVGTIKDGKTLTRFLKAITSQVKRSSHEWEHAGSGSPWGSDAIVDVLQSLTGVFTGKDPDDIKAQTLLKTTYQNTEEARKVLSGEWTYGDFYRHVSNKKKWKLAKVWDEFIGAPIKLGGFLAAGMSDLYNSVYFHSVYSSTTAMDVAERMSKMKMFGNEAQRNAVEFGTKRLLQETLDKGGEEITAEMIKEAALDEDPNLNYEPDALDNIAATVESYLNTSLQSAVYERDSAAMMQGLQTSSSFVNKMYDGASKSAAGRLMFKLPFMKTFASGMQFSFDRTPVLWRVLSADTKRLMESADSRDRARAKARIYFGSSFIAAAGAMFGTGMITTTPLKEEESVRLQKGDTGFSLNVGGKYIHLPRNLEGLRGLMVIAESPTVITQAVYNKMLFDPELSKTLVEYDGQHMTLRQAMVEADGFGALMTFFNLMTGSAYDAGAELSVETVKDGQEVVFKEQMQPKAELLGGVMSAAGALFGDLLFESELTENFQESFEALTMQAIDPVQKVGQYNADLTSMVLPMHTTMEWLEGVIKDKRTLETCFDIGQTLYQYNEVLEIFRDTIEDTFVGANGKRYVELGDGSILPEDMLNVPANVYDFYGRQVDMSLPEDSPIWERVSHLAGFWPTDEKITPVTEFAEKYHMPLPKYYQILKDMDLSMNSKAEAYPLEYNSNGINDVMEAFSLLGSKRILDKIAKILMDADVPRDQAVDIFKDTHRTLLDVASKRVISKNTDQYIMRSTIEALHNLKGDFDRKGIVDSLNKIIKDYNDKQEEGD